MSSNGMLTLLNFSCAYAISGQAHAEPALLQRGYDHGMTARHRVLESPILQVDMHTVCVSTQLMLRVVTPGPFLGLHVHSSRAARRANWKYRGYVRRIDPEGGDGPYALLVDERGEKVQDVFLRSGAVGEAWPDVDATVRTYRTVIAPMVVETDEFDAALLAVADSSVLNPVWLGARSASLESVTFILTPDLAGFACAVRWAGTVRHYLVAERPTLNPVDVAWGLDARRITAAEYRGLPVGTVNLESVLSLTIRNRDGGLKPSRKYRAFTRRVLLG